MNARISLLLTCLAVLGQPGCQGDPLPSPDLVATTPPPVTVPATRNPLFRICCQVVPGLARQAPGQSSHPTSYYQDPQHEQAAQLRAASLPSPAETIQQPLPGQAGTSATR